MKLRVFNNILNRDYIEKLMNSVVDSTSRFFDRNYKPSNTVEKGYESVHSQALYQNQQEWDLNQGVSDIMIKDIRLSINWLLPDRLINTLIDIKHRIILYFYLDEIDEEESSPNAVNKVIQKHILSGVRDKIVESSHLLNIKIASKVVSFHAIWKSMIRKLEILLRLEPDPPTFYLIGRFSPGIYNNENESSTIRGPDHAKLTSSYPFHKRN